MKPQGKFYESVLVVIMVTLAILSVPLIAMQFTGEVNWSVSDFVIMGIIIFATGISYVWITQSSARLAYRVAVGMALASAFLMVWANLAVGLIGSGPHAGNLMFVAVLIVGIVGTILSNFRAAGMERVMYAMAGTLGLLAVIALIANMQHYPGSSAIEIIGVTGFFAMLFVVAGLFFRYAAKEDQHQVEKSEG